MKVTIIGATGLIGEELVRQCINHASFGQVRVLARKPLETSSTKLDVHVINFDDPATWEHLVEGDAVLCALGTTIKKAGSQPAFEKVDLEYPAAMAKAAAKNGVTSFHLVSSLGADKNSGNFYLRTKGKAEEAIQNSGVSSTHVYRPSILFGDRKEFRLGERIGTAFMVLIEPLLKGRFKKYRGIEAEDVAGFMIHHAIRPAPGHHVYESDVIAKGA